jgi:hypothetical protein
MGGNMPLRMLWALFMIVSIDWLLTGRDPVPMTAYRLQEPLDSPYKIPEHPCPFCSDMSEEMKVLCKRVNAVMESGHRSAVPALLSNITAFEDSVEQAEDLRKLKETVRHLEKLSSSDQNTGTGRAAGTGMQKKKM